MEEIEMTLLIADTAKQPWEEKRRGFGWERELKRAGTTIDTIDSISVFDKTSGADITLTAKKAGSEQKEPGGYAISAIFVGGTGGQVYSIEFRATALNGEKYEGDLELEISADGTR
jgi:hypothetical protein